MSEVFENESLENEAATDVVSEETVFEDTPEGETVVEEITEETSEESKSIEELQEQNEEKKAASDTRWYVVHTYSGYENKVKADIEKTIENRKLQDQILEVLVPLQEVMELKNGAKKQVSRKMFPGYVLLNMVMNDATWYVVRNTRGVTGFVGPGSKPVPLTEDEMRKLGIKIPEMEMDVELGDMVKVTSGAWAGTIGTIADINPAKQSVTIEVDIFGRATSVEISFMDVTKVD